MNEPEGDTTIHNPDAIEWADDEPQDLCTIYIRVYLFFFLWPLAKYSTSYSYICGSHFYRDLVIVAHSHTHFHVL